LIDQQRVTNAKAGDLEAFRAIFDGHKLSVFRLAYDMTGNRHDAEDITQEVFIKAFRSLGQFRGDAKVSTWLYRITVNACFDYRSKKSWTAMKPTAGFEDRDLKPMFHPHASQDPEASAEGKVILQHIEEALESLTPRERSIFVMRHYNDLSLKEIAVILRISEGTVKSMLFRALRRLQQKLEFYRKDLGLEETR